MKITTVVGLKKPFKIAEDPLTELLRTGAKKLIAEAVEAKLQDFLGTGINRVNNRLS